MNTQKKLNENSGDQTETAATIPDAIPKQKRGHVQDQVLERLRQGLAMGVFLPGQTMSLRKLAAALNTSAMPVRNALGQLVAAHVLEELPNRTVCVPRLTESRLLELFEIRSSIEGKAAHKACNNATPALIRGLHKINVDLLKAIERRDHLYCLRQNQNFHFTLYQAADSELLMTIIESLWLRAGPTMYLSLLSPEMPWGASAHGELIEALQDKDTEAARHAIEQDIQMAAQSLLKIDIVSKHSRTIDLPVFDMEIQL